MERDALFCVVVGLTDAELARVNAAMDRDRKRLGRTWKKVAELGGITTETLRAARRTGEFSANTRRAIETGLNWTTRGFDDVIAGREPAPLVQPGQPTPTPSSDESVPRVVHISPRELAERAIEIEETLGPDEAERFLSKAMTLRAEWARKTRTDQNVSVEPASGEAS